jgi:uncharacterized membrane protein
MNKLIRYFIQGVLIIVPIFICLFVIYWIFDKVGSLMQFFGITIGTYVDPLIGLIAVFLFILIVGILGSSIMVQPILVIFDRIVERTPFVKTLYSSVKDLLSAFVGSKKKFNRPVLVTIDKVNSIQQLGFITHADSHELGIKEGSVAVYLPNSYALSGKLIVVPQQSVTLISASSAETMKFIVSGGVTDID